ncbi:MAG: 4-hydroxy-tetrahydrodipicolinate synthase [Phycisphaerae bacterium]|nr:4-hydroxy-tetrahydrodipicolinate synthase [Phycisphaerae bacterium]
MSMQFHGTYTALITPFRDGKLDLPALEKLVALQLEAGVDGLVPCGTTGESPTLEFEEYEQVVRTVHRVRESMKRRDIPILAGSGTNCTKKTIELSKRMRDCGADGLLIVAPYYNRPSQEGIRQHYVAIAKAVPLPIMLYNIPGRCGVEVSVCTIARIREQCENLVAVKHATGKVDGVTEMLAACRVDVLSGDDPLTLAMMSMGAVGVVSVLSNLAPAAVGGMTRSALAGDWESARVAHEQINQWGRALLSLDVNPVPIKTALALRGVCHEEFRLPIAPLNADKKAELAKIIAAVS